jgi:hypothetical protein
VRPSIESALRCYPDRTNPVLSLGSFGAGITVRGQNHLSQFSTGYFPQTSPDLAQQPYLRFKLLLSFVMDTLLLFLGFFADLPIGKFKRYEQQELSAYLILNRFLELFYVP